MLLTLLGVLVATAIAIYFLVQLTCPWIKYDIQYIRKGVKIVKRIIAKLKAREFAVDTLERQVRERPQNTFIIYQDNHYTYEFVDQRANQIARVALGLGLKAGDVVAVMMLNEPAFVWMYFGLQKIGASVSLINYHHRQKSLVHSVTICKPKVLIVGKGEELTGALKDIKEDIGDIRIFVNDPEVTEPGFESLASLTSAESCDPVDYKHRAEVQASDIASFIFTSGTTGLPKPAIVTHKRTVMAMTAYMAFDFNENDILYETLPLYHSAALNLGVLPVIDAGAVMILKSKFSASNFWLDCRKHNVTVIHYIGELCRYLVNRPRTPEDGSHSIRVAVGNGLRTDIWKEFQQRFRIPKMAEFYAATESPIAFSNIFNKVGVVGRSSPLTQLFVPCALVKFDHVNQVPVRDAKGRCIKVKRNEPGLLISPLDEKRTFEGYYNRTADTQKKLLKDVFQPGDVYFNTGDLLVMDDEYFLSFHDRIGDTYRWKGENVSTSEVANVLSAVSSVHDANVYGVTVAGCEGKAGMAAIHLKEGVKLDSKDLDEVSDKINEQLPAYARPRFLRVQRQMSLTSTFKQQKVDLVNEAFDPRHVDEPLYYLDKTNHFQPLTEDVFEDIVAGKVSL